ncbi:MAG: glycosyltransferase [Candidatus Dormibacteria bacterium]
MSGQRRTSQQAVPALSVVVPTRNEAENVGPLMDRLCAVLSRVPFEVIFVDDSDDDTPAALEGMARRKWPPGIAMRYLHRPPSDQTGLGSAVAEGLKLAGGAIAAVMDSDLQHPPELLPAMVERLEADDLDIVVASRYVPGGSAAGLAGPARRAVSSGSKILAQLIFREARKTSDPLSGYFVCRRSAIEGVEFRPIGFKILLEVLVCASDARVGDIPLSFARRHAGRSNASMAQGMAFLKHLYSLLTEIPGSARFWKYAMVGGAGLGVFLGLLAAGRALGLGAFQAWALAFTASLFINWQLNQLITFRDVASPFSPGRSRPVYLPVALLGGLLNLGVFTTLLGRAGPIAAGSAGAFAAMALNYSVHRRLLGRSPRLRPASNEHLDAIIARIGRLVPGEVTILDPDADEAILAGVFGGHLRPPTELLRAASERHPILIAEAPSHVPQARQRVGLAAWMGVPLLEGRRYQGLLVAHRQGQPFSADELQTVLLAVRSTAREDLPRLAPMLLDTEGSTQA